MAGIENLSFAYRKEYPIFLNFTWSIAQGERWSVIGPSGCGKTTLLYLMTGLLIPNSGKINLNGTQSTGNRLSTGLILQDYGLLPWLSAFDNVALGLRIRKLDSRQVTQITGKWLSRLGIDSVASHYPTELSGGQRQRVAIARTLALEPDLLLMDEPFASLDALTREELQNSIISLWESLSSTIVLVTHSIEEAVFLGRRIMVLNQPPNTCPVIIENPGSGYPDYRRSTDFVEKCQEVRAVIEEWTRVGQNPQSVAEART